jgi:glycosyltransferase involved in cell wall biosynthesis
VTRILVVQGGRNESLPSGEQVAISNEFNGLREKGVFVHVDYGVQPAKRSAPTIFSKIAGVVWSHKNYKHIINLIELHNPDVVHFHSILPYLSLSVIAGARRKKVPIVQTLHNGRWLCLEGGYYRDGKFCDDCVGNSGWKGVVNGCAHGRLPSFLLFLVNFFARSNGRINRWIDSFIAVSSFVRDQHVRAGFPTSNVRIKNNGIDLSKIESGNFKTDWSQREGIVFAGRVSDAKGVLVLKYIIGRFDVPIHVVGDGPDLEDLKKHCLDNEYTQVVFWGNQTHEKTLSIVGSVRCAIIPSQCGESFPSVAVEAMALGTPIVASDLGGLTQLINESSGGVLVEPSSFSQFAAAVKSFVDSPGEAERTGKAGIRYVSASLSHESKNQELINIYTNVIAKSRG